MIASAPWLRRVLIGLPFLWLAVFFLAPLLIVAGISLTESADAIPPFEPPIVFGPHGIESNLTAANYRQLAEGCLKIYARSLGYAASTTLLCLLIGFPMALAIARAPGELARAPAVSRGSAVLDQFSDPGLCLDRAAAAERADQPRAADGRADRAAGAAALQRVFAAIGHGLLVPAVHDPAALRQPVAARRKPRRGRRRSRRAALAHPVRRDRAAGAAGHRRRRAARVHPGGRRVRDPRPARRPGHADDRQAAVAGVLRQCRLAGGVGDRGRAGRRC